jgi:hypothetical protein
MAAARFEEADRADEDAEEVEKDRDEEEADGPYG